MVKASSFTRLARSRVWAEPCLIEAAKKEYDGVIEEFLAVGEKLFGPYVWGRYGLLFLKGLGGIIPPSPAASAGGSGSEPSRLLLLGRYDILFMPPSFPFGGMENPCLTFATPCLLAGDRSLVDVIIHEISHSWFGNLVTNATWGEFWLNEGFTMYAQRRISTEVYGAWPCPAVGCRVAACGRATAGRTCVGPGFVRRSSAHPPQALHAGPEPALRLGRGEEQQPTAPRGFRVSNRTAFAPRDGWSPRSPAPGTWALPSCPALPSSCSHSSLGELIPAALSTTPPGHTVTSSSSGAPGAVCCIQINLNGSKNLLLTEGWVAMPLCNSAIPMPCSSVSSFPSP